MSDKSWDALLAAAWELLKLAADAALSIWGRRCEKAVEGR